MYLIQATLPGSSRKVQAVHSHAFGINYFVILDGILGKHSSTSSKFPSNSFTCGACLMFGYWNIKTDKDVSKEILYNYNIHPGELIKFECLSTDSPDLQPSADIVGLEIVQESSRIYKYLEVSIDEEHPLIIGGDDFNNVTVNAELIGKLTPQSRGNEQFRKLDSEELRKIHGDCLPLFTISISGSKLNAFGEPELYFWLWERRLSTNNSVSICLRESDDAPEFDCPKPITTIFG